MEITSNVVEVTVNMLEKVMEVSRTISINLGNCFLFHTVFPDNLQDGLCRAVDTLGDRLVAKASQLTSNNFS